MTFGSVILFGPGIAVEGGRVARSRPCDWETLVNRLIGDHPRLRRSASRASAKAGRSRLQPPSHLRRARAVRRGVQFHPVSLEQIGWRPGSAAASDLAGGLR